MGKKYLICLGIFLAISLAFDNLRAQGELDGLPKLVGGNQQPSAVLNYLLNATSSAVIKLYGKDSSIHRELSEKWDLEDRVYSETTIKYLENRTAENKSAWDLAKNRREDIARQFVYQFRNAYGDEVLSKIIRQSNRDLVESEGENQNDEADDGGVACWANSPSLRKFLNSDESQQRAISNIIDEFNRTFSKATKEKFDNVSKLDEQKLARIKLILDDEQNSIREAILGDTINWFALSANPKARNRLLQLVRAKSKLLIQSDAPRKEILRKEFLEKNRFEFPPVIDSLWLHLITEPVIHEALELTAEQKAEIEDYARNSTMMAEISNELAKERLSSLVDRASELPAGFGARLLNHQVKWLNQAELQIRVFDDAASLYVLAHPIRDRLNLSQKQIASIEKVVNEMKADYSKLELAFKNDISDLTSQRDRRLLDSMTPEQRVLFLESIGIDN